MAARLIYAALPIPLCLLDGEGRLVGMNPAAQRFWGVRLDEVAGALAADVLGIRPVQDEGGGDPLGQARQGTSERVPCRITGRDGVTHVAFLVGARLEDAGAAYTAVGVVAEQPAPSWALTDPVTALPNRLAWQQERSRWAVASGAVVLLDLDDLKAVNDLYGHRAGDQVLAIVGQVLRALTPPGGLALRYGGDEFLVLLPQASVEEADRFGTAVAEAVAAGAAVAAPLRPTISFGAAPLGEGGVEAAIQQADDMLYERKGVLLRAASGARLTLTREGQGMLRTADEPPPAADHYAGRFTAEFDSHFRAVIARAVEEAKAFVAFVNPRPGIAAVEVGAGAGRITFDGDLANRIGPAGQLLLTDPSEAQLRAAQQRARASGLHWVRFLRAPAESLPLASASADLVIGGFFLHFTDPPRAIAEMARILRPGGQLALSAPLPFQWPPFWQDVLAPVWETAQQLLWPTRHWAVPESEILAAMQGTGALRLQRVERMSERAEFPSAAVAQVSVQQTQMIGLMLRGAPPERIRQVEEQVLQRIAACWEQHSPEARAGTFLHLHLLAERL